ncbi:MAG: hypothetical protein WCF85_15510 [Rhodospirillaceae bacterium]
MAPPRLPPAALLNRDINAIPSAFASKVRAVARHELGHYVVARVLGVRTDGISVELSGNLAQWGHHGQTVINLTRDLITLEDVVSYLETRVIVLYAGACAEALPEFATPGMVVDNQKAVSIVQTPHLGAAQDHAKVREHVHLLRNIRNTLPADDADCQSQLDAIEIPLWNKAVGLVSRYADTIVGVSLTLSTRIVRFNEKVFMDEAMLSAIPKIRDLPSAGGPP